MYSGGSAISATLPSTPASTTPVPYYVIVVCDANGSVTESNTNGETNNTKATNQFSIEFTKTGTMNDRDGNTYKTVKIGTQWWMAENLKVTHYRNGDPIPKVTGQAWCSNLSSGAYCSYDNNEALVSDYGRLYNWFAVNDSRNLAPSGWHVPSNAEWQTLINYLGDDAIAGGKMKETGTSHWNSPNTGATNESGFTALPGGEHGFEETCVGAYMGKFASFWSSTKIDDLNSWRRQLCDITLVVNNASSASYIGMSIRCIKD